MSLLTYVIPVVIGCLCAILALGRGRSPIWWFVIGMILGWLGILVLFIIPPVRLGEENKEAVVDVQPLVQECSIPFNWFYLDSKKETKGPFSADELKEKWLEKVVSKDSWVWNQAIETWKKISEVPSLLEWLEQG